jgi:hypothetical protein
MTRAGYFSLQDQTQLHIRITVEKRFDQRRYESRHRGDIDDEQAYQAAVPDGILLHARNDVLQIVQHVARMTVKLMPAAIGVMPLLVRTSNCVPSASSSSLSRRLIADEAMCSRAATLAIVPPSTNRTSNLKEEDRVSP